MSVLLIEHPIKDFDMWKIEFDTDPIDRRGLGVRRHTVFRPTDDNDNVAMVELEFDTRAEAESYQAALHEQSRAHGESPKVRIVDVIEDERY